MDPNHVHVFSICHPGSTLFFTCSGCRESELCGLCQWAVLLFGFSLALVNWRAEESVYVIHPALSLLWIKAGCTPLLLGSSKIVLGISVTVSSP